MNESTADYISPVVVFTMIDTIVMIRGRVSYIKNCEITSILRTYHNYNQAENLICRIGG